MKPLKRVVIKEELVALTGDITKAMVLNQLVYWSERVRDVSEYKKQENARRFIELGYELEIDKHWLEDLEYGWIYKSAQEMADELMMPSSRSTISRIFTAFEKVGWINSRRNPKNKMDKTKQYRVDIVAIQRDLYELGYNLEGYPIYEPVNKMSDTNKEDFENSNENVINRNVQNEQSSVQFEQSNVQNAQRDVQNEQWNGQNEQSIVQKSQAIPEITTKTTSEIISETTLDITSSSSPALNELGGSMHKNKNDEEELEKLIEMCMANNDYKQAYKILKQVGLSNHVVYQVLNGIKLPINFDIFNAQIAMNANKAQSGGLIDYAKYFLNGYKMRLETYASALNYENQKAINQKNLPNISLHNWLE